MSFRTQQYFALAFRSLLCYNAFASGQGENPYRQ